jgi:hypothetical protein
MIAVELFARRRDTPSLGHFDYQFCGSAAGHYFSLAALFVWHRRSAGRNARTASRLISTHYFGG